jgi:uncharacterized protein YycO
VYIGNQQIIETAILGVRISPVTTHPDAKWGHESLSDTQRTAICDRAHALIGTPYDWPAYVGFSLEILKLRTGQQLDPVFRQDNWRVCSALVVDCYSYAGVTLFPNADYPNLITPDDLYRRITTNTSTASPLS